MIVAAVALALLILGLPRRRLRPPRPVRRRKRSFRRFQRHATDIDLGVVALEVSTRLRSGASLDRAWEASLTRSGLDVVPPVLDEEGRPRALLDLQRRDSIIDHARAFIRGGVRLTPLTRVALPSLLAAAHVSWHTGAPVADVLDECADGLTEAGEAQSARQIAMSGPKSTATMLAWLPIIGLGLGVMMGVDPLGFLTGTSIGRICLIAGLGAEIAGLLWVRKLVTRAEMEGAVGS